MLGYTHDVLQCANSVAATGSVEDVLSVLRRLPLSDFGEFMWSLPNHEYSNISNILPKMADIEVQNAWTGANGQPLLISTYDFVTKFACCYMKFTGSDIHGARILDYGCGYGRMLRLMYYFTNLKDLWGVDPWDEAIRICQSDRLLGNLAISDYLPTSLPVGERQFDAIYAYSVFTHTSERATKMALTTLRNYVSQTGLCAITIRPREFWGRDPGYKPGRAILERIHDATGFAFAPHQRAPVDGDITYGDTTMTFQWLEDNASGWKIACHDRSLNDPFQLILFLRPV